jgi:hypothetical protein
MELRTEIEIARAPSAVWSVLLDFPSYPDWNPFIPMISGEARAGATLEVLLASPSGREMTFHPKVLLVTPEEELRWFGHFLVRGLFDGEHFFRLTKIAEDRTRFVHGENFSGILQKAMTRRLTDTARGFVFMNQALKRRVESVHPASATASRV